MTIRIRGSLAALPAPPRQQKPGLIRMDLNEITDGPLPGVVEEVSRAASRAHRYPDPLSTRLAGRIAEHEGVSTARVAVGCGATSLIQQLVLATCDPHDEVVFGWPSFEAYPMLARIAGARSRPVPTSVDHALDLEAMAASVTGRTRLVFICNPNNPTGTVIGRDELLDFIESVPSTVLIVLDEAYRDFVNDDDVLDGMRSAAERDNVVVLRTFSKAYGLAGLRVGYALGAPTITAALRQVAVPFAVSTVAQIAAKASIDAHDQLAERCQAIAVERDRMYCELREVGYAGPASHGNFLWLPLGGWSGSFEEHCLKQGIAIRTIARRGVRVTVAGPEENNAFLEAARSFFELDDQPDRPPWQPAMWRAVGRRQTTTNLGGRQP
jgi:histidinol-phosphate aminotransferase